MMYSDNEKAIILLCADKKLTKSYNNEIMTAEECNDFIIRLIKYGYEPKIVFENLSEKLGIMQYDKDMIFKICNCINRGAELAFSETMLDKKGIYFISIINKKYPVMLKRNLGNAAPPVLYCAGNADLLNKIGIYIENDYCMNDEFYERIDNAIRDRLVFFIPDSQPNYMLLIEYIVKNGGGVCLICYGDINNKIKNTDIISWLMSDRLVIMSDNVSESSRGTDYLKVIALKKFIIK